MTKISAPLRDDKPVSRFGEGTCPFRYPDDPLMYAAWRSLVDYTMRSADARAEFTAQTGKPFPSPPKNGLEASIDSACGVCWTDIIADFIEWINVTYWGEDDVSIHPLPKGAGK